MNPHQDEYNQQPYGQPMGVIPNYTQEEEVKNIVGQIDPQRILDNLNHALKGEYYVKERGEWANLGEPLINDAGRAWIISYFTSVMNNASTMGIISEKQFSFLMEGVIGVVNKNFRCNLEKFGFVPPSHGYEKGDYENKGSPDTARMDAIAEMIYQRAFLIYSRSLKGTESNRIFRSLKMADTMGYNLPQTPEQKKGFISRMFGK